MLNTFKDAVSIEQAAFYEDEFYQGRERDMTSDELEFIDFFSTAHTWHVLSTLPHIFH